MATNTLETFTTFYEGWLLRHHHLQEQLSQIDNVEQQLHKLIEQTSDHYREYYQEKSSAIEHDIFLMCSPPWYTSFERTLFWVGEFPPSMFFQFVGNLHLKADQAKRVETVRVETARRELEIAEAMAMVQESLAVAPLYGLVNRTGRLVDGQVSQLDDAMEEVKEAMRVVMTEADNLRVTAAMEILDVLDVNQKVMFLAAIGEFRIRARRVGLQMNRFQGVGTL